jgi:hypothetical protein
MLAPLKYAELMADLAECFGWYPSRMWGSESPPQEELAGWGLFDQPAPVGMRVKY